MKTIIFVKNAFNAFVTIAIVVAFLAIMVTPKAESAVVTTDISVTEWNNLISTYPAASWSVVYRGGGDSGFGSEQIRLARNIATPQIGGGANTIVGAHTWSRPDQLEVKIDGAGNISARAGSTIVSDVDFGGVTRPFNQILIRVFDNSQYGASDLQDIGINNFDIRDMFADGLGPNHSNDIISVHNFGAQAPFNFNANWHPGDAPISDQQYVWIVALQNTTIPEPSSIILTGFISLLLLRRQR